MFHLLNIVNSVLSIMAQNYFTCPLGQAAQFRGSFETIIHLVDHQATHLPDTPALGFADFSGPSQGMSYPESYSDPNNLATTFRQLRDLSLCAAETLSHVDSPSGTIGLLCTSSTDFISTWLGLMRLGYSVLFLA